MTSIAMCLLNSKQPKEKGGKVRQVIVDRFMGKPLTVIVSRGTKVSAYTGSRAKRMLECVNRILIEQVPSIRKKGGLLDRMTFVVIPSI